MLGQSEIIYSSISLMAYRSHAMRGCGTFVLTSHVAWSMSLMGVGPGLEGTHTESPMDQPLMSER